MNQKIIAVLLAGCVLGVWLRSFVDFGWAGAGFFVFLGVVLFLVSLTTNNRQLTTLVAIFMITVGLGIVRYEIKDIRDLSLDKNVGSRIVLQGIISDEPDERENYIRLVLNANGAKILLTASRYPEFHYGDEIKASGVLKRPKNLSEDFNWQDYLAKDDIYYEIFYPNIEKISENKGNFLKRFLFKTKEKYLNALAKVIPEPHSALMGGLTVGAKQSMPKDLLEDFRKTGIVHIIVLSGYNITLVADFVMRIFSFLPRFLGIGLGVIGIILFAIMTGASATVVRASIMALLVILARATGRLYQITWALFLTGFFMIMHNPKILRFDTGFQLSFLATLALIWLAPYFEKKLQFIPKKWKLREISSATIATQIFVLPLLLYKMGLFSVVSLPVNLLILLFVPVTMFFGFITGGLGMVWSALSIPFGWISYGFLQYELFVVKIFANLPFSSFNIKNFPLLAMWGMYAFYGWWIYKLNKK
ncbi:MAG: ComEC/Rec2 family competence protein [Candidatus Terrybacteria bacterium]|nr:ComEC/Rec2 family competence protein [Candidatus Terrybacteria bacterium]